MSLDDLELGRHKAICTGEVQTGKTSTGKDQVGIEVEFQDGTKGTAILYFSEAASRYSIPKLKACGWKGGRNVGEQIKGNEIDVIVKDDAYTNPDTGEEKITRKVEIYDPNSGFVFKEPMTESARDNFFDNLSAQADTMSDTTGYPASFDEPAKEKPKAAAPAAKAKGGFKLPSSQAKG
jgi:hypothetical protein